jgi:MFS family permease
MATVSTPTSRRPAVLLGVAMVLAFVGGTIPSPLYGIYQERLGWSTLVVTGVYAAYALGTTFALVVFGRASDELGRRRVLLIGLAIGAVSALIFPEVQKLSLILVARVLSGVSGGVLAAASIAALAELSPGGRLVGSRWGSITQMIGLGSGPILAGLLAATVAEPLKVPYWTHVGLLAVAALIVMRVPDPGAPDRGARLRLQRIAVPPEARGAFFRVAPGVFGALAVQGFFAALSSSFLRAEVGITSPAVIGLVGGSVFLATAAGAISVARLGNERSLRFGSLALPTGLVLAGVAVATDTLAATVCAAVVGGLSVGLTLAAAVGEINQAAPADRRAEANAALLVVLYTAISVPSLGVGIMAQLTDLRTAIITFLGVVAVLAVVSAALVRRGLREDAAGA